MKSSINISQLRNSECSKVSRILPVSFDWTKPGEINVTPPHSHGKGATAGEISIKTNLNTASSRIFNPENHWKAYCS